MSTALELFCDAKKIKRCLFGEEKGEASDNIFLFFHLIFKGKDAILALKNKMEIVMISIEDKILARIKRKGEGWVMTNSDFGDLAKSPTVDWSLYRLKDAGVIRPLLRGIYDYPKYSDFLHEKLTPDMTLTAQAIARKFQWRIQISGSAALNYLGLSTQVPMRLVYFSDGPHRAYEILGRGLEFKHISLKESQFSDPKIEIVIQSIRELGEAGITPEVMQKIRDFIPPSEREKLMKATQYVADWIHDKIKLICDGK